jgi:hypothetical protein
MKNNFSNQSGQAFMELTIMLLILTAMMLAIVLLSGLEISSNNMLLSARQNALNLSRAQGAEILSRENELNYWSYMKLDLRKSYIHPEKQGSFGGSTTMYKDMKLHASGDGTINIPFSYQGFSSSNNDTQTLSPTRESMTSGQYSNNDLMQNITNILTNRERYNDGDWRKLSDFDSALKHDFSDTTGINAFNAAGLISATGSTSSVPATINAKHQAGSHSAGNASDVMYKSFHDLFGIKLNDHCLCEFETNKVYMPVH